METWHRALILLLVLILWLVPAPAGAAAPERSLVQLRAGADPVAFARDHGATLVAVDAAAGIAVMVGPQDASALARDHRVVQAEPDGRVRIQTASWDTASWNTASWQTASWTTASWQTASWQTASWDAGAWAADASVGADASGRLAWGLAAINATGAWRYGVPPSLDPTVCIVDTGISPHPRLSSRLWHGPSGNVGIDVLRSDGIPDDENGHGTHLAGIVAATAANDGFRGVSAASIASAKVLGPDGTGSTGDVIAGISWCGSIQARVILLALSEDSPTRALKRAIETAQHEGALVVASAGNNGPCQRCVTYPAAYPGVMSVAAAGQDGRLAPFSAQGPQVSLAAPGVDIFSTYLGGTYRIGSGTSQAAAFAAGAAALLMAQEPRLSAKEVASIMTESAVRSEAGLRLLDVGAASSTMAHAP